MTSRTIHTKEFVVLASSVFGANWPVAASDALGVRRETLLLTLDVDGPVPDELARAFVAQLEQKLENDQRVLTHMSQRIADLRQGLGDDPLPEKRPGNIKKRQRSA